MEIDFFYKKVFCWFILLEIVLIDRETDNMQWTDILCLCDNIHKFSIIPYHIANNVVIVQIL